MRTKKNIIQFHHKLYVDPAISKSAITYQLKLDLLEILIDIRDVLRSLESTIANKP